jgi:hypothetical protein
MSAFRMSDAAILRALRTGSDGDALREYFGLELYDELCALAATIQQRQFRGGPKVLILPGIMGSKLGRPRGGLLPDNVLWIDPLEIAAGRLSKLALPAGATYKPLGVLLLIYAKLLLTLQFHGFDAELFPYDWRLSIDTLAQQLVARIGAARRPVSLVAHSMGGLVSRRAMSLAAGAKIDKLIMLGTPNFGSFAPVQVLRGTYSTLRQVALLDLKHSPEFLARRVFRTFPGIYQMLPSANKYTRFDLYDPRLWPATGPAPSSETLRAARDFHGRLAAGDARMTMIAGVNQDTVTNMRRVRGAFVYESNNRGDGTVPLAYAMLPGARNYYVDESHSGLPNNAMVIGATMDVLRKGRTKRLRESWSGGRGATRREAESKLHDATEQKIDWRSLSASEREHLLAELAGSRGAAATRSGAPAMAPKRPARRRAIEIRLALGSITEAKARALILGVYRNVEPAGAAAAVDAKLDGAIAEFTARRMFSGNSGEIFIMPVGRQLLRADLVIFAGMGDFDRYGEGVQQFVAENVVRTLMRTQIEDFATVLLGAGSGVSVLAALQNQLRGYFRALAGADQDYALRRITFCEVNRARHKELRQALQALTAGDLFAGVDASFEEVELPAAPVQSARTPTAAPAAPATHCSYLVVSQEERGAHHIGIRTALLTAGSKAAVLAGSTALAAQDVESLLADLRGGEFSRAGLQRYGEKLARALLQTDVRAGLVAMRDTHLVVVHDAAMARIPWETLAVGEWAPAATAGLSRRYAAENLSVAKWSEERSLGDTLEILLVANPTQDLAGADREGERLQNLFGATANIRLQIVRGAQATRERLLREFQSGAYDVLHYAGHAFFDAANPARSGILCAGHEVLTGGDLLNLRSLPALVVFNACESGRLRGAQRARAMRTPRTTREALAATGGLAEAYLRGGVANYVGTYWPVGDTAAMAFATAFYSAIVRGERVGPAVNQARAAVRATGSVDWADYMHYGNFDFALKRPRA